MKISNVNAVLVPGAKANRGISRRRSEEVKKADLALLLAKMGYMVSLGQLLAESSPDGRIAAVALAQDGILDLGFFEHEGVRVTPPNAKISLKDVPAWGCPTCGSATGSGYGQSDSVNPARLAEAMFFLDPRDGRIFNVSPYCWDKYFAVEHSHCVVSFAEHIRRVKARDAKKAETEAKPKGKS